MSGSMSSTGGRAVAQTVYADAAEQVGKALSEAVKPVPTTAVEQSVVRQRLMRVVQRHKESGFCKTPILEEMVEEVATGVFGQGSPAVTAIRDTVVDSLWSDAQNRRRLGRVWEQLQEQASHV